MTTPAILLRGGRIVDPSQKLDGVGDVLVVNGVIEAVGRIGDVRRDGDALETIDCTGRIVSPGFVDVHCHLREPGREEVEVETGGLLLAQRPEQLVAGQVDGVEQEPLAQVGADDL